MFITKRCKNIGEIPFIKKMEKENNEVQPIEIEKEEFVKPKKKAKPASNKIEEVEENNEEIKL